MKVVSYGCHSAWCLSGADQQALPLSSHPLAQTLDVGFLVFLRGFPVPLPRYCREIRYMRYIPSSGSGLRIPGEAETNKTQKTVSCNSDVSNATFRRQEATFGKRRVSKGESWDGRDGRDDLWFREGGLSWWLQGWFRMCSEVGLGWV